MSSLIFSRANKKFNVIILAAGKGTRLKPETDYIAKPLVEIANERAIDYFIKKYQHIAHKIVIAIGYEADLLENYVRGKYSSMNIEFSKEDVEDLKGAGQSLVYALDYADSKYPTIITFCDYIVDDVFSVDNNAVCVCDENTDSVLGNYKTIIEAEEGVALNILENYNNDIKYGFTGIIICHDTILLKAITYSYAIGENIVYENIVKEYIDNVKTSVIKLEKIYDFGDQETLEKTRSILNGHTE
jgi:NDP-sugar pyrophosphorylase family protein